ncbi:MAG TPA: type II toxin-antitoxin system RelB/DinJ family antitoxin [Verrucomicrobiae bacterium]
MTEQIRLRIERGLLREADEVCREIGVSPSGAVSMFFAQLVKLRGLPFRPSHFPALEEYGATPEQATAAVDTALAEIATDRKAGRLKKFTGKL